MRPLIYIYSCTDDAGRRILPQELLQVLARGLHPDDVLLRRAQRDPLLQDPLLAAVQGEGQLQPPHPDSSDQEERGRRGGCSRATRGCDRSLSTPTSGIEQRLGAKRRK
jgi:hypothetical protein